MLIGMGVGMARAILFSLGLGMYRYRLDNEALWLAFGHRLYAAGCKISYLPVKKRNFITRFGLCGGIHENDVSGILSGRGFIDLS